MWTFESNEMTEIILTRLTQKFTSQAVRLEHRLKYKNDVTPKTNIVVYVRIIIIVVYICRYTYHTTRK